MNAYQRKMAAMRQSMQDKETLREDTNDNVYNTVVQATVDGLQQAMPDLVDTVIAAGQFGREQRYQSAGWLDKLKKAGSSVASNVAGKAMQNVMSGGMGGLAGLMNNPSALLDAVKSAAVEGVQESLPDVAQTMLSAANFASSRRTNRRGLGYELDENGQPDPISYAAAVYRGHYKQAPPPSAYASGRFSKPRPLLIARGQFGGRYRAGGPDEEETEPVASGSMNDAQRRAAVQQGFESEVARLRNTWRSNYGVRGTSDETPPPMNPEDIRLTSAPAYKPPKQPQLLLW